MPNTTKPDPVARQAATQTNKTLRSRGAGRYRTAVALPDGPPLGHPGGPEGGFGAAGDRFTGGLPAAPGVHSGGQGGRTG